MFDDVTFDTNALIHEAAISGKNVGKVDPQKKNDKTSNMTAGEYDKLAMETTPGFVISFSGAQDHQTAADVNDASSFGLKPVTGPEKSGGATTNAFHYVLQQYHGKMDQLTYSKAIIEMSHLLKERKYSQIPSVATSHQINLVKKTFTLENPLAKTVEGGGRRRALIIGINYYDKPELELGGCLNDCKMQIRWLRESGWPVDDPNMVRIITDKRPADDTIRSDFYPTAENILNGMEWLVKGAKAGDSLFLHYSGHGSQLPEVPDEKGIFSEADHMDETLVSVDFQTAGQIRDNTVFKLLVAPLPAGVQAMYFFDACHTSSILDVPHIYTADSVNLTKLLEAEEKISHGEDAQVMMQANPDFNFDFAKKLVAQVLEGGFEGLPEVFDTLFVGDAARARWLNCQRCCYGMCFGGEANLYERRGERRARLEKEKQEQELKEKQQQQQPSATTNHQPLTAPLKDNDY